MYLLTTGSFLASIGDGFEVSLENQNVVNMCVLVGIIDIMFKINVNLKELPVSIILTELGEEEELQVKIYDRIIEEGAGSQSLVIIESNGDGSSFTLGILTQVLQRLDDRGRWCRRLERSGTLQETMLGVSGELSLVHHHSWHARHHS